MITTETVPVERVRLSRLVQTEQQTVSGEVRRNLIDVEVPGQTIATIGDTR